MAAALDIAAGDRITSINGYPPAGGLLAGLLLLQRDPDRNDFVIRLQRGAAGMQRALVVR